MPYIPELRISPHDMITYNHTLPRVSAIYTAPTGLESACVVLVYGLGWWLSCWCSEKRDVWYYTSILCPNVCELSFVSWAVHIDYI